jgi:flagellin
MTSNYSTSTAATPTNPGSTTVLMLSDNTGFGTPADEASSQTNSLNEVLNQLNALGNGAGFGGIADSSNGSGGITTGTAFTVDANSGQIVAVAGGGGSVTKLSDGSMQYSYANPTYANQTMNLVVANVSGLADNATDLTTALSDHTDSKGATTRAAALTALANAANAAGFTASLGSNNTFTITGANLDTSNAPTVSAINNSAGSAATATATAGPNTLLTANATATTTSTTAASNEVHGVQQLNAQAAISNVTAAINALGAISSQLGTASDHITGMQTFTSSLSSALTAGVGALTDADMATESAQLTSLQTKQQLGIQALSIANQQPQILLKLFG